MEQGENFPKKSRVLALSMRPGVLDKLIGQDEWIASIQSQFQTGRVPHFYILSGPVGSGKTTMSRILALMFQDGTLENYKKYDIRELNAANQTGVDDMRSVIESMRYQPIAPSKAKVVIFDEAHQLSVAAQNVLITETEDVKPHVFYIFCTSIPNKIIDALKRRAFHITPKPLTPDGIRMLVTEAAVKANYAGDLTNFINYLDIESITSPGLVLQACERFFLNLSPSSNGTSIFESLSLCRAVSTGDWDTVKDLCKNLTKADVFGLKASICGYLKSILLKSSLGDKSGMNIANAIKIIDGSEELPVFIGSLFTVCGLLKK